MKDFNSDPAEYGGKATEYREAEETRSYAETKPAEESASFGENGGRKRQKKSSRGSSMTLFTSFFVAAVVVVSAGAVISSSNGAEAEIARTEATNTAVSYEVNVESGDELEVILYDDFTHRSFPLGQGVNRGSFEDLRSDAEYTVAVVGNFGFGEKTIAKTSVRTTDRPDPVTQWRNSVETVCRCTFDGYFYFRMDFTDENGYFCDFSASLTDIDGNVAACVFSEDLHDWQRIDIADENDLVGREAHFTITCRSQDPASPQETLVLWDAIVKI